MDVLLDNLARVLATPMPRRKAFRLLGGAIASALFAASGAARVAAAQCTTANCPAPSKCCGSGNNSICCASTTCCANKGSVTTCCAKGRCVCTNGTCANSTSGQCPTGCGPCV